MKAVKAGFEKSNFYPTIISLSVLSFAMCLGSFYLADKLFLGRKEGINLLSRPFAKFIRVVKKVGFRIGNYPNQ